MLLPVRVSQERFAVPLVNSRRTSILFSAARCSWIFLVQEVVGLLREFGRRRGGAAEVCRAHREIESFGDALVGWIRFCPIEDRTREVIGSGTGGHDSLPFAGG